LLWEAKGWRPDEQQEWLEILAPVLRKAPWKESWKEGDVLGERYSAALAEAAAQQLRDEAFQATRMALTQGLPSYVTGVTSIGPRYKTFDDFCAEARPERHRETATLPGRALTDVIAAEFFVPSPDPRLNTRNLLRETVAFVTGDREFRDKRTAFYVWQEQFLAHGVTDAASLERAVEEMTDCLSELRKATNRLKIRKRVKNVFRFAPTALGLLAARFHGGLGFAAAGAFISVGSFVVEERLFKAAEAAAPLPAAFVFDARRQLGWN
jgi:hypothetical protein